MAIIKLLRPKHYFKNLLIFFPVFFGRQLNNGHGLLVCFFGFLLFCTTASFLYIINDLSDRENDRKHPEKANRPLASGAVSVKTAGLLCCLLVFLAILIVFFAPHPPGLLRYAAVPLIYVLLNLLYTFHFKKVPIIDIVILVSGFFLRIYYGSLLTDIPLSTWMYLTIICGSFYLSFGKRRNELMASTDTRPVLKQYSHTFLDKNMYMFLSITIVFYALWAASMDTQWLLLTVPLLIFILLRYNFIVEGSSSGDPVEVLFSDKLLLVSIAILALVFFFGYYGQFLFAAN